MKLFWASVIVGAALAGAIGFMLGAAGQSWRMDELETSLRDQKEREKHG